MISLNVLNTSFSSFVKSFIPCTEPPSSNILSQISLVSNFFFLSNFSNVGFFLIKVPLSDLSADDVYTNTTRTYAYGKVLCNFNPGGSLDEAVQTDGTNNFQVLISGTSIEQLEGEATQTLNFSSIDEGLMTAIIDVQGGTLLNNEGESAIFSSISEEEDKQFNWDSGTNYKISDWV